MSDALKQLTAMANLMRKQIADVELATEQLQAAKAALLRTRREDIPELMRELGLEKITLGTGETISVKDDVSASIPEARKREAFAWLDEHGLGGVIKTSLVVNYSRGEHEAAVDDAELIGEELNRAVTVSEDVHPQTLRALIREQMAAGNVVPFDLFGIHPYSEAKIA